MFILIFLFLMNIFEVITQWNSYPIYLVGILKETDKFEYVCAGTLYTNNFVITAAHCVNKNNPTNYSEDGKYSVIYGINFDSDFGKYVNNRMPIIDIELHPNYNQTYSGCNKYDIAILKLQSPVFSYIYSPIAMDKPVTNFEEGVMAFWEKNYNGEYALQFVTLQIFNRTMCEIIDNGVNKPFIQGNICAASYQDEFALKLGDCGSPLITGSGVLSGILHCALGNRKNGYKVNKLHPAVFLRISDFYSWIKYIIEPTEHDVLTPAVTESYDNSTTADNSGFKIIYLLLVSILCISFFYSCICM